MVFLQLFAGIVIVGAHAFWCIFCNESCTQHTLRPANGEHYNNNNTSYEVTIIWSWNPSTSALGSKSIFEWESDTFVVWNTRARQMWPKRGDPATLTVNTNAPVSSVWYGTCVPLCTLLEIHRTHSHLSHIRSQQTIQIWRVCWCCEEIAIALMLLHFCDGASTVL